MLQHPTILKLGASTGCAIALAFQLRILSYRRGTLRIDDNGELALIGLIAICFGLLTLAALAIEANINKRQKERHDEQLSDAVAQGIHLAENDAQEKLMQKSRRTMTPPADEPMH